MVLAVKNLPANAGDVRDVGSIPGSGRSPGGGHGNPIQNSSLKNPKGRGIWRATVHRVAESDMTKRLSLAHNYTGLERSLFENKIYLCEMQLLGLFLLDRLFIIISCQQVPGQLFSSTKKSRSQNREHRRLVFRRL